MTALSRVLVAAVLAALALLPATPAAATDDGGSGGWFQPFAVGCRTVTVTNTVRRYDGSLTARLVTGTHWCWNRSKHRVYDVRLLWTSTVGYGVKPLGLTDDGHWYDWAGHGFHSGYVNDMTYKYSVSARRTPTRTIRLRNVVRAHSDGSWTWKVED